MSANVQHFYNACDRVQMLKTSDHAIKQAVFSEHFVGANEIPTSGADRIEVAAFLGTLLLEMDGRQ